MISRETIATTLADLGEPAYRTRQVYEALTRGFATDFAEVTTLPVALRRALAERLRPLSLEAVESRAAPRGAARKTLFRTADGEPVEAVLMTYRARATVCVSTQVGCAVGCAFCASGRLGLRRDLSAEEIVDQVLHFARELRPADRRVTNVVFMGMGEPFHNYDETLRACRMLNDEDGFGLAARAISVSTVGVVPGMDRFSEEPEQFNLAVSLHAATDALRDTLVPLNLTYPLDELFAASARYVRRTHRKLMFEYVVLRGVNDTDEQVQMLSARVRPPHYHLNLIAYNETGGDFRRPRAADLDDLRARLESVGVSCTVRSSPGGEIEAACGQLALEHGARSAD
ncbi:MAG: 23S rRNA (adenine(2503)-C(2))-methyltransferase RlmN [Actinomycetes bacterium]